MRIKPPGGDQVFPESVEVNINPPPAAARRVPSADAAMADQVWSDVLATVAWTLRTLLITTLMPGTFAVSTLVRLVLVVPMLVGAINLPEITLEKLPLAILTPMPSTFVPSAFVCSGPAP